MLWLDHEFMITEYIPHDDEPKEAPEQIFEEVMRLRSENARLRCAIQTAIDYVNGRESEWGERADKLAQAAGKAAAEIAGDFHAASGRPMTPDEADRVMKLGGEIAKVIMRHITEAIKS